jgi:hypothetical protein
VGRPNNEEITPWHPGGALATDHILGNDKWNCSGMVRANCLSGAGKTFDHDSLKSQQHQNHDQFGHATFMVNLNIRAKEPSISQSKTGSVPNAQDDWPRPWRGRHGNLVSADNSRETIPKEYYIRAEHRQGFGLFAEKC